MFANQRARKRRARSHTAAPIALVGQDGPLAMSRGVLSRGSKAVTGFFPSFKSEHRLAWESELEMNFLYLLDADPKVERFAVQPGCLHLIIDGRTKEHHPDVLVILKSGARWLFDVKHDDHAEAFKASGVQAATARACLAQGYGYDVKTKSKINQEPDLWNAKLISDHRAPDLPLGLEERVRAALATGPESPITVAPKIDMEMSYAYGLLLHFTALGVLNFDRSKRLTAETEFHLVTGSGGLE